MAYKTYTTEALVVSSRDRMGSDRMVRLFTEDAGMLDARAVGVREEKSKMRYALQPFSFVRVTLVRGKREWRLTGVEAGHNTYFSAPNREVRASLLRVLRLVDRFVVGEESNTLLYHIVVDGVLHLITTNDTGVYRTVAFRILTHLGYIAPHESLVCVIDALTTEEACARVGDENARAIDTCLEHALTVSHL